MKLRTWKFHMQYFLRLDNFIFKVNFFPDVVGTWSVTCNRLRYSTCFLPSPRLHHVILTIICSVNFTSIPSQFHGPRGRWTWRNFCSVGLNVGVDCVAPLQVNLLEFQFYVFSSTFQPMLTPKDQTYISPYPSSGMVEFHVVTWMCWVGLAGTWLDEALESWTRGALCASTPGDEICLNLQ